LKKVGKEKRRKGEQRISNRMKRTLTNWGGGGGAREVVARKNPNSKTHQEYHNKIWAKEEQKKGIMHTHILFKENKGQNRHPVGGERFLDRGKKVQDQKRTFGQREGGEGGE